MIAEIKYKLTEYGISIKINTCRFTPKKNSDYPNHIADKIRYEDKNSVLSSNPRAIRIYNICCRAMYLKTLEHFSLRKSQAF